MQDRDGKSARADTKYRVMGACVKVTSNPMVKVAFLCANFALLAKFIDYCLCHYVVVPETNGMSFLGVRGRRNGDENEIY